MFEVKGAYMADLDFKTGRLSAKYKVTPRRGTADPDESFFVLRADTDPHARVALMAYAAASKSLDKTLLLRDEWVVEKSDGRPSDPGAEYFALPLGGDKAARTALRAYAVSLSGENRRFAADILAWLWEFVEHEPTRCGCREAMCPHTPFLTKEGFEQLSAERRAGIQ